MEALFEDAFLKEQIAMRGGTLLHKVHLAPASRYSEDIDLVVVGARPAGHIRKALVRILEDLLGPPVESAWSSIKLAVRNAVRPSRVLRLAFSRPSLMEPGTNLKIKVEANATERTPYLPVISIPFLIPFRDDALHTHVRAFDIHEMLGTKLRALFQRTRGRDLFDLYWALTMMRPPVIPERIIESFQHYLRLEKTVAGRAEFLAVLDRRLSDRGFCSDMTQLLRQGLCYDPQEAGALVKADLLSLLPEY